MSQPPQTKVIKARTKQGKRILEQRAPKLVEDPKRALILFGNKTSQTVKDILTDIHKLKGTDCLKFSRKNDEVKPFEPGGEVALEQHGSRGNCSLFALGSNTKKRPNNMVLGRMYDFRLYDMIEFGVHNYSPIKSFGGAADSQLGNKPSFIFVGEAFENDPVLRQVRSLLLDYFRGQQIESINLKGLDRCILVTYLPGDQKQVLFRQYSVKYKKSGTRVPRVDLIEMGPSMDLEIRRTRQPPVDLEQEAMKQPKLTKKKEKNVGTDVLEGKVGRIYMPKQDVASMALRKMKGLKRERREAAGSLAEAKKQKADGAAKVESE